MMRLKELLISRWRVPALFVCLLITGGFYWGASSEPLDIRATRTEQLADQLPLLPDSKMPNKETALKAVGLYQPTSFGAMALSRQQTVSNAK